MTNVNKTPTAVRDLKGQAPVSTDAQVAQKEIQVHPGNTAVLTVQFLNQINEKLFRIEKLLQQQVDNG